MQLHGGPLGQAKDLCHTVKSHSVANFGCIDSNGSVVWGRYPIWSTHLQELLVQVCPTARSEYLKAHCGHLCSWARLSACLTNADPMPSPRYLRSATSMPNSPTPSLIRLTFTEPTSTPSISARISAWARRRRSTSARLVRVPFLLHMPDSASSSLIKSESRCCQLRDPTQSGTESSLSLLASCHYLQYLKCLFSEWATKQTHNRSTSAAAAQM